VPFARESLRILDDVGAETATQRKLRHDATERILNAPDEIRWPFYLGGPRAEEADVKAHKRLAENFIESYRPRPSSLRTDWQPRVVQCHCARPRSACCDFSNARYHGRRVLKSSTSIARRSQKPQSKKGPASTPTRGETGKQGSTPKKHRMTA
jgi:hypothetical protein